MRGMVKETLKKMGYKGKGVRYDARYDDYYLSFTGDIDFEIKADIRHDKTRAKIRFYPKALPNGDLTDLLRNLFKLLKLNYELRTTVLYPDAVLSPVVTCVVVGDDVREIDERNLGIEDKGVLKELIELNKESVTQEYDELLSGF